MLNTTLLPHQTRGVRFLRSLEPPFKTKIQGAILADEMGLGKTIQTIALIDSSPLKYTLIVCPSSLQTMWTNQFKHFAPHINIYVFSAINSLQSIFNHIEDGKNDKTVIITTYGLSFRRPELNDFHFDRIVCDEAHYFRNPRSKTCKALMNINATFKLLLTGTPIQNSIQDIITLINFIIGQQRKHSLEFVKLFIEKRMLRRKINDIGIQLPPLDVQYIDISPPTPQKNLVQSTQSFSYQYQIEKMIRAKQAAVFPQSLNNSFIERYELPKFNVDNFKSNHIVSNIIQQKQPCLLFAEYFQEIKFFKQRLLLLNPSLNIKIINGSTIPIQRDRITHDLSIDVLIIQINAGACGLNLQHFSHAHFSSIQWNPAQTQQAIGRIQRIGQTNPMKVFIYSIQHSFEQHIQKINNKKISIINTLIS